MHAPSVSMLAFFSGVVVGRSFSPRIIFSTIVLLIFFIFFSTNCFDLFD